MQASRNPYGLNNFLQRWARDNPPKLSFKARTKAAAKAWKRRFVTELKQAIGPMPKPGSLRARRALTKQRRGFRIEMLYLKASPWHEVPVHLLVPEGAKRAPVVLARLSALYISEKSRPVSTMIRTKSTARTG